MATKRTKKSMFGIVYLYDCGTYKNRWVDSHGYKTKTEAAKALKADVNGLFGRPGAKAKVTEITPALIAKSTTGSSWPGSNLLVGSVS